MSDSLILQGDSLIVLKDLPDNSIDSVVTDPPYGLKFMGKKWDYNVPSKELWTEVLRVLKPGGHLLSFGGTRTYHRLASAIEDAGFEIRDQIQWLYGSGFPKSHNIKKGEFKGYGTALKPANEPLCMARKPLDGTVAQNLAKWGVGGLNIDASRIGTEVRINQPAGSLGNAHTMDGGAANPNQQATVAQGRWPANLLLDETAAELLGEPSRFFYVAKASKRERGEGNVHPTVKPLKLMEYLIKLITPHEGTILDPFMGSGSTGVAAKNLGYKFIGIELSQEYVEIAEKRIANIKKSS